MSDLLKKNYKFRGGAWIAPWAISWPFITLEVRQDQIILNNELFRKEYSFTRSEIQKIEIKKHLPIIGYGIKICHAQKDYGNIVYFWYVSFHFHKLVSALKEFGWLNQFDDKYKKNYG